MLNSFNEVLTQCQQSNLPNHIPGYLVVHNTQSQILYANQDATKICGYKKNIQLEGEFYENLLCPAADMAPDFYAQDQHVIATGKTIQFLSLILYSDGWHLALGSKSPLYQDNKLAGLISHFQDTFNSGLVGLGQFMHELFSGSNNKQIVFNGIESCALPAPMTPRQHECLFLLLCGKTLKTIGQTLHISERTVESHLDQVKRILQCDNKSQLIEKSLELGLMNYLPQHFWAAPSALKN